MILSDCMKFLLTIGQIPMHLSCPRREQWPHCLTCPLGTWTLVGTVEQEELLRTTT